jgi:hypothetical protein
VIRDEKAVSRYPTNAPRDAQGEVDMERSIMREVQAQLQSLRPLLLTERGQSLLDFFDEYVEQREFELALHIVCDFLLETNSPQVNKSTIDKIQHLHAAMKIDDGCVEKLFAPPK